MNLKWARLTTSQTARPACMGSRPAQDLEILGSFLGRHPSFGSVSLSIEHEEAER